MVSASMTVQHAKWLQEAVNLPWRAPIASLNILLTSTCWRNDHNGFSHQGPGLIDVMLSKRGTVARIYLPPDANCLLSVADHCLRSRNYVNLIVIDKQPQLQCLDMDTGDRALRASGASIWQRASSDDGGEPDVVLGCAGDIPTLETVAAAWCLRRLVPDLRVRVVNVVDLMRLFPARVPPPRHDRGAVRRAVHRGQARRLRLPRLPAGDSRDRARAPRRRPHPRARIQRAGHDDHTVPDGGDERDEPLPPGSGSDPPRPAPARPRAGAASPSATRGSPRPPRTPVSTSRTSQRSATGCGPTEPDHRWAAGSAAGRCTGRSDSIGTHSIGTHMPGPRRCALRRHRSREPGGADGPRNAGLLTSGSARSLGEQPPAPGATRRVNRSPHKPVRRLN